MTQRKRKTVKENKPTEEHKEKLTDCDGSKKEKRRDIKRTKPSCTK